MDYAAMVDTLLVEMRRQLLEAALGCGAYCRFRMGRVDG